MPQRWRTPWRPRRWRRRAACGWASSAGSLGSGEKPRWLHRGTGRSFELPKADVFELCVTPKDGKGNCWSKIWNQSGMWILRRNLGSVNLQKCGWCEGSIQKMVGSNWYLSYGKNGLGEGCKDLGDEVETWATAWDFTQTAFVADPSLPHNSAQFFGFLRNAIVHSPEICFKAIKIYCRKLKPRLPCCILSRWISRFPWGEGLVAAHGNNALALGLCEALAISGLVGEALFYVDGWDGLQRCGVRAGVRTWMWMEMAYHQQLRYSRYSQQHWIYDWLVIWHSSTLCSITSL